MYLFLPKVCAISVKNSCQVNGALDFFASHISGQMKSTLEFLAGLYFPPNKRYTIHCNYLEVFSKRFTGIQVN